MEKAGKSQEDDGVCKSGDGRVVCRLKGTQIQGSRIKQAVYSKTMKICEVSVHRTIS